MIKQKKDTLEDGLIRFMFIPKSYEKIEGRK
jgi:hypothetical protein